MKVVFSKNAEHELEEIIDYLYDEWGQKAKDSFLIKLAKSIDIISKQPKSSPESREKPTLRRKKVVKQISLFYIITKDHVSIVSALDNRKDPKIIKRRLRNFDQ